MTDSPLFPDQIRAGFNDMHTGFNEIEDQLQRLETTLKEIKTPSTREYTPSATTVSRRLDDIADEMRNRFKQLDHEKDRKHEFWSGFGFGIIVGIGVGLIIFLLTHGLKT